MANPDHEARLRIAKLELRVKDLEALVETMNDTITKAYRMAEHADAMTRPIGGYSVDMTDPLR